MQPRMFAATWDEDTPRNDKGSLEKPLPTQHSAHRLVRRTRRRHMIRMARKRLQMCGVTACKELPALGVLSRN